MTEPPPHLPGGLDLRTALKIQERHAPDTDALRRQVLTPPLPRPAGGDRRRRLLATLCAAAVVIVAVIAMVGITGSSPDQTRGMYPWTDSLPCPERSTDYRPATDAPGADRLMVPGHPRTVDICSYVDGRIRDGNQPYSTDDPDRPEVAAIAAELNQTTSADCQGAGRTPTRIVRFSYPDGSVVDVLVHAGTHCSELDNGRRRTSAPGELLVSYDPPACDSACWSAVAPDPAEPDPTAGTFTSQATPATR